MGAQLIVYLLRIYPVSIDVLMIGLLRGSTKKPPQSPLHELRDLYSSAPKQEVYPNSRDSPNKFSSRSDFTRFH